MIFGCLPAHGLWFCSKVGVYRIEGFWGANTLDSVEEIATRIMYIHIRYALAQSLHNVRLLFFNKMNTTAPQFILTITNFCTAGRKICQLRAWLKSPTPLFSKLAKAFSKAPWVRVTKLNGAASCWNLGHPNDHHCKRYVWLCACAYGDKYVCKDV